MIFEEHPRPEVRCDLSPDGKSSVVTLAMWGQVVRRVVGPVMNADGWDALLDDFREEINRRCREKGLVS